MSIKNTIAKKLGFIPRTEAARLVKDLRGKRHFEATQVNRLTRDFVEMSETINAAIRAGGERLRNLSRQMYTNSTAARRWVDLFVINVVGESGYYLQSDVKILEEDPELKEVVEVSDDEKNNLLETHFAEWCKAENCSLTRNLSYGLQKKIIARHKARDGEMFIRRIIDPSSKYGLRLQLIPPELIPDSYTTDLPNGSCVVMGIEFNSYRQPVAYYILKEPALQDAWGFVNKYGEMERVPASDMIHLYDPDFSNQSRGFSRMANVLLLLTWQKQYNEAHVLNAKFSARKLGFIVDANPEDPAEKVLSDATDTQTTENLSGQEETTSRPAISGEALTFTDIGSKRLEKWDPAFPSDANEMFNRVMDRDIARGLNLAYCSFAGDYSNSTWSSARTELDVERKGWKHEQQLMVEMVDNRVYAWWLELALMKRAIPGFTIKDFERLNKPYFSGPSFEYINPLDESAALRSDVEAQFISEFDVAAKKGKRLEDVYRDKRSAARLRKKYNIPEPVYGKTGNVSSIDEPAKPAKDDNMPAKKNSKQKNGVAAE
jgi:lambda family phage portal protein